MRKFIKKVKNSIWGKILKLVFNLIKWALQILIVTIAIIIVVQRVSNSEKAFLGYRIFSVATGSMEPDYMVGDILICKEKDPSTIKVGDNIVYLGNKQDYTGKVITHAVIKVERNEMGEYLFHTKGIANTVEDPIVHEDQVYGTVVNNNVLLAILVKIISNRYGLYFLVIIPIILYVFVGFVKSQGSKIEEERAEQQREREKQKEEEQQKRNLEEQQKEQEILDEDEIKKEPDVENAEEKNNN